VTFQGFPQHTFIATQYASTGFVCPDGADLIRVGSAYANDGVGLGGGLEEIHLNFQQPTFAVGCDYFAEMTIRLYWHGQMIAEHDFPFGVNLRFAGLVSDAPFDAAVMLRPTGGEASVDDLYFAPPLGGTVPVKPATRIMREGQTVVDNGNPITLGTPRAPTTNSLGQVAFNGNTSVPGNSFIWIDDGVAFLNSDVTKATLSGSESCMGLDDNGGFIFSPSYDGSDALYTNHGLLLGGVDPIPALPGLFAMQNYWPTRSADGSAFWITTYTDTPGGDAQGRAIMRCPDPSNPASMSVIVRSGDLIDGFPMVPIGGPAYRASLHGDHIVYQVRVDDPAGGSRLLVDGKVVARHNEPPDGYTLWGPFYDLGINDNGDYIFSALVPSADELIAINGNVVMRSGDVFDGVGVSSGTRANSIDNLGKVAIERDLSPAGIGLFYGDIDDMPNAACLLKVGDMIDYTGDGIADAGVTWLNATTQDGPGITLSDHNFLFIEATLLDVGSNDQYEAILRLDTIALGNCPVDINASGAVDSDDLVAVILGWGPCPQPCPPRCPADITGNCAVDADDLVAVILNWGDCP
jgi:hypothetical protein